MLQKQTERNSSPALVPKSRYSTEMDLSYGSLTNQPFSPQEEENKYKKYQDLMGNKDIWKMVMNGEDHVFGKLGYDINRYYINSYRSSETYTANGKTLNFPLFNTQQPVLHPLSDESQTPHEITDEEIFDFLVQNQLISNPLGEEYLKEIKSNTNINNIEIPCIDNFQILSLKETNVNDELNLCENGLIKTKEILKSTQKQDLLIQSLEKLKESLNALIEIQPLSNCDFSIISDIEDKIETAENYINELKLKTSQENTQQSNTDQISKIVVFLIQTANKTNQDLEEQKKNAYKRLQLIREDYEFAKQAEQQIKKVLETAEELAKSFVTKEEHIPILNFNNRIENLLNQLKNNQKILPEYINSLKFEALRNCSNTKLPGEFILENLIKENLCKKEEIENDIIRPTVDDCIKILEDEQLISRDQIIEKIIINKEFKDVKNAHPYKGETGYMQNMLTALKYMLDNLGKPIDKNEYTELHNRAVNGVNGMFSNKLGIRKDNMHGAFGLNLNVNCSKEGIKEFYEKNTSEWISDRLVAHNSSSEDIKKIGDIKNKTNRNVMFSANMFNDGDKICNIVFDEYYKMMECLKRTGTFPGCKNEDASLEDKKLEIIARICQNLDQMHLFEDGNIRTIGFLLLNKLLIENDLSPTIMTDPNVLDFKSIKEIIDEIKKGQVYFQQTFFSTSPQKID